MKLRALSLALLLAASLAAPAMAKPVDPANMGGTWGVSFGQLPIDVYSTANVLGVDYWVLKDLVLQGFFGGAVQSYYAGGTDAAGKQVNNSYSNIHLGAGARYTVFSPVPNLHLQAVGSLAYDGGGQDIQSTGVHSTSTFNSVALYAGIGVEAFVPGWNSLSFTLGSGLTVATNSSSYRPSGGGYSLSNDGAVFPFNLGVNYYF